MRTLSIKIVALAVTLLGPTAAMAKLDIFACEPEWGALASQLGGEAIEV